MSERRAYDTAAPSSSAAAAAAAVELEGETVGRRRRTLRAMRLNVAVVVRCGSRGVRAPVEVDRRIGCWCSGSSRLDGHPAARAGRATPTTEHASTRMRRTGSVVRAPPRPPAQVHLCIIIILLCGVYVRVFAASACQGYTDLQ